MKRQPTVMVVEDDPQVRESLTDTLVASGHAAISAVDGSAAIAELATARPDLVCVDQVLPQVSGYRLCEFIRSQPELRDVPILMMSGRALPEDLARAEEVGANAYLSKPFSQALFKSAVSRLLRRRRIRSER